MQMNLTEFRLCPNCGCPDYNDPPSGDSICVKCGYRIVKIPLTQISESIVWDQVCTVCHSEGVEGDTLYDNELVVVFKCQKCGTIDGYFVRDEPLPDDSAWSNDEPYDGNYSYKSIKIAEEEGTLNVLSAANYKLIAKALKKKEKDPKVKCKKSLQALVYGKEIGLEKAGFPLNSIKEAIFKVERFIDKKGEVTDKKLMILFFTALYVTQKATAKDKNSQSIKLKERAMQELSGIDRKTIRKWKKVFEEKL